MLERIDGLPDNVLGFDANGELTGDDYTKILIPTVEQARKRHEKLRLLYVPGEAFTGLTGEAVWGDTKAGLTHVT